MTKAHWSRDPGLDRFAAITMILMGVASAVLAVLERRWFGVTSAVLMTAGIIDLYIVAHRATKQATHRQDSTDGHL
jgi:hypothetical protein